MSAALALAEPEVVATLPPVALRRTFDALLLNAVANDADVRPWLQGEGTIDLSAEIANPANYALVTDGGGFFLQLLTPGEYEVHSMFLPSARGSTVEAMRQGLDYMFTRTDCVRLVTRVPDGNKRAANLAAAAGFQSLFRRDGVWNGSGAEFMALDVDRWAMGNPSLEAEGEWFHDQIERAVKAARPDLPDHPDDEAHDRAVGASVRMIRAGAVHKGVAFYNRWARFAGYTPTTLVSLNPPTFDVSEPSVGLVCLVELRDDQLEILLCR